MKEYIRLTANAQAYYSGNTYFEELFLPLDVWNKIKDDVRMHIYLCEFDGKHSEVKADIDIETFNEKDLESYVFESNDGESLFYYIDEEYIYGNDELSDFNLQAVQSEVQKLSQVDTMTIMYNVKDKETILNLLKDYIL